MSGGTYRSDYQYSPADCDVRFCSALETFRAKRDEWLHWLHHDQYHAISRQISGMLWSDAVFRLINESRKHAHQAGEKCATQSRIIARSLDRGYVAEQVISFRRLMEKSARDPKRQVISLRRLIDDVRENRHLLTREMFVCHDGLPFDDRGGQDDLPPPDEHDVSVAWVGTTGPRAFGMASLMHAEFDTMMNAKPAQRDRDDLIGDDFFDKIETALDAAPFEKLRRHANKMLLHAADEFSRGGAADTGVALNDVWSCHKAILMVANRVSVAIGGSHLGGVPIPQYDVLEHWDAPFAPKAAFDEMMDGWGKENERREQWCQGLFERQHRSEEHTE